jgi:hypothetical protein
MATNFTLHWPTKTLWDPDVQPIEWIEEHRRDPGITQQSVDNINADLSCYRMTGNPWFAWSAIQGCLAARVPLPEALKRFLLTVTTELLSNGGPSSSSDERWRDHVNRAVLGLSEAEASRRTRSNFHLVRLHREIVLAVDAAVTASLASLALAPQGTKAQGPSRTTMTALYEQVAVAVKREPKYVERVYQAALKITGDLTLAELKRRIKGAEGGVVHLW